ncbi:DinB family protein [Deinococcus sp. HMF7604]|uniref:DinB family protein n=1 Tax=Deinococcus betulae TaxID=2873312 RepID=UPI001CCF2D22|nr:DinB family protein [Deinococcus betulae]MBZ9749882.1 DinB family protein [Deinococcus betulae]
MSPASRPAPSDYSPFYETYVALVDTAPILETLEKNIGETRALLSTLTDAQAAFAYAPGKWTLKQVLGHMVDTERVFAYRALRAARGDHQTALAGYDDEAWAATWNVAHLSIDALSDGLQVVRNNTLHLLRHLEPGDWQRRVTANGTEFTVQALGFIIAGHELHHRQIVRERYLSGHAGIF